MVRRISSRFWLGAPTHRVVRRISFVGGGKGLTWADQDSIHTFDVPIGTRKDSPFVVGFNDREWSPSSDGSLVLGRESGVGINMWGSVDGKARRRRK